MPNVTIYSTPTCHNCALAKAFFQENDVAYKEHNVAADRAALETMFSRSGQMSVPVIEIGKDVIVGFDKFKIKKLLRIPA